MKNKKVLLVAFLLVSTQAFSLGGVEILTTPTVGGLANPVQQAEVSPDSVFYNPAALGFLEEGSYLSGGMSVIFPDYKMNISDEITGKERNSTIKSTTPQGLGSLSYVYSQKDTRMFLGLDLAGQGGILPFDTSGTLIDSLHATLLPMGMVFGAAQKLNEKWSVSLSGRYMYFYEELRLNKYFEQFDKEVKAKYEVNGYGLAPEVGVYYKPTKDWDLSAAYLFRTKLIRRGSVKQGNQEVSQIVLPEFSTKTRRDYPAVLTTGASYTFGENKIYIGYNQIFEGDVVSDEDIYGVYDDTKEYMIGYQRIINDKWTTNVGYTHVDRARNNLYPVELPELHANSVGVGLTYNYSPLTKITYALGINFYNSVTSVKNNKIDTTSKRREINFGIGMSTKL